MPVDKPFTFLCILSDSVQQHIIKYESKSIQTGSKTHIKKIKATSQCIGEMSERLVP